MESLNPRIPKVVLVGMLMLLDDDYKEFNYIPHISSPINCLSWILEQSGVSIKQIPETIDWKDLLKTDEILDLFEKNDRLKINAHLKWLGKMAVLIEQDEDTLWEIYHCCARNKRDDY